MDLYLLLVFVHVSGAMLLFGSWGIEAVLFRELRRAITVDEASYWLRLRAHWAFLAPVGMMSLLVSGIAMTWLRWGMLPWPMTALAGLILVMPVSGILEQRALPRIKAAVAKPEGLVTDDYYTAARLLAISLSVRFALGAAIVGLMTMKPALPGSITLLVTGLLVATAGSLAQLREGQPLRHKLMRALAQPKRAA